MIRAFQLQAFTHSNDPVPSSDPNGLDARWAATKFVNGMGFSDMNPENEEDEYIISGLLDQFDHPDYKIRLISEYPSLLSRFK